MGSGGKKGFFLDDQTLRRRRLMYIQRGIMLCVFVYINIRV